MHNKILPVILIFFSAVVSSEPNSTLRYLYKQPVNLLDFGIYKLERKLTDLHISNVGTLEIMVTADWDNSKIRILGRANVRAKNSTQAKSWCTSSIQRIREQLGVNTQTGEPWARDTTSIPFYFAHDGLTSKNEPKSLGSDIEKITVIESYYAIEDSAEYVECEANLLGNKVMYSK